MGAIDFTDIIRGENDIQLAYGKAVDRAISQCGNDPYNGSISTTSSARAVTSTAIDIHHANNLVNQFWEDEDTYPFICKWETCGAIPLLKEEGDKKVEKRSKKITLDAVEFMAYQKGASDAIRSELKPLKDHIITTFRVQDVDCTTKVETKATEGERETRYLIEGSSRHRTWETGFASQADARAWIDSAVRDADLSRSAHDANNTWGIYAVTRRANGNPLVTTRRIVKRAVLTVEYDMVKPSTSSKQDGWMFFGWAAC